MQENFLGAFVSRRTLSTPALTAWKHTCGSLRIRLHKPHVANLTAARFTFAVFCIVVAHLGSRWLCGNTLASDASGSGSTPGGSLELDTGYHPFVGR